MDIGLVRLSLCDNNSYNEAWRLHFQAPRRRRCFRSALLAPQAPTQSGDVPPLHSLPAQLPSACDLEHNTEEKGNETRDKYIPVRIYPYGEA